MKIESNVKDAKPNVEKFDILQLCNIVPNEVLALPTGGKGVSFITFLNHLLYKFENLNRNHISQSNILLLLICFQYDVDHDPESEKVFENWLQCYSKDGMKNLVDKNGRTIWFYGSPGKLKPAKEKSRGSTMVNRKKLTKVTEKENKDDKSIKKEIKQELSETLDTEKNTSSTNNNDSLKSKAAKKPMRKRKQSK